MYVHNTYTHVLVKTNISIQKRAGFLGGASLSHLYNIPHLLVFVL